VYVMFMNSDGTVRTEQKISATQGNPPTLDSGDWFGYSVGGLGDIDADGVDDLLVGAMLGEGGVANSGEGHILLLNSDGTVKASHTLSDITGPSVPGLSGGDHLGTAATSMGDLDGDGTLGFALGARSDGDGGTGRGAVYPTSTTTASPISSSALDKTTMAAPAAARPMYCS